MVSRGDGDLGVKNFQISAQGNLRAQKRNFCFLLAECLCPELQLKPHNFRRRESFQVQSKDVPFDGEF